MAQSTRFAVEGRGDFPLDMLRSDRCWPDSPADTAALLGRNRRTVWLRSEASTIHVPTRGRWSSFNWQVTEVQKPNPA